MQESPTEHIPEAWIGQRVIMEGAKHSQGVLKDVNQFGLAYETVGPMPRIFFVSWHKIRTLHLPPRREAE